MKADAGGGSEDVRWDDLAIAARDGDGEAFERLVVLIYPRVHRWALVRVGDPDDAEDVTQTVLVRLHRKLASWRGESRFSTWLYRVTANEASNWRRRVRRRARWIVRDAAALERAVDQLVGPSESEDRERQVATIVAFLRELPARQREVCDLVDVQGYTPGEVSDMLGLNPNTVRANLFKGRRTIRARVSEESER